MTQNEKQLVFKTYSSQYKVSLTNEPHIALVRDSWDDYGYKTSFRLFLVYSMSLAEIGYIKILHRLSQDTFDVIPKTFHELSGDFISLGQSLEFYRNLEEIAGEDSSLILKCIRDFSTIGKADELEQLDGFHKSLLRFSESLAIWREKKVNYPLSRKDLSFHYSCRIGDALEPHEVSFDFNEDRFSFERMYAIIGKNGTGKTKFLANLARDLSGISHQPEMSSKISKRPDFTKVIAVSYSIFDEFEKPSGIAAISYAYCGFRRQSSFLEFDDIEKFYLDNLQLISRDDKFASWEKILNTFFSQEENEGVIFDTLSSGQKILLHTFSSIVAQIEPYSLILFDEPETHLHSTAISAIARILEQILVTYNSYAIISTHSTKLIQEFPAKQVIIFDKKGRFPIIRKLPIESFGEDIDVIDEDIFGQSPEEINFKSKLEEMAQSSSFNEIIKYFDGKLDINALGYLESLFVDNRHD